MRVLLARRFRGNSNLAHLLEEEGDDPQGELEEEDDEEEAAISDPSLQLPPPEHHQNNLQQQPRDSLLVTGIEKGETRPQSQTLQKPISVVSPQQQQQQKSGTQRKRRLTKPAQEENHCKLRRRQTTEEPSLLDRKPRARETGIQRDHTKKIEATGENTSSKEAAKAAPGDLNANNQNMVSDSQRRHDNSKEGEEEENLLNWPYVNANAIHHPGNLVVMRVREERDRGAIAIPEVLEQPTPAMSYEELLENDPASARGDISSASPERQDHVIGRREESPSLAPAARWTSYERGRIAPPNRRDMSRIAPAAGSERGTLMVSANSRNGSYGNPNAKQASTTFEENRFRAALKKERGLEIREQDGDGNCLFRAISLQVYGDPSMHGDVRKHCMDHMERDQEHFSQFVTGEPFLQYVARTRQDGVHGNNPEIQASSELFNRPIEVFTPENGSNPLNIFHTEYKTGDVPIRLSYHDGNHYNAVIDPLVPTAGLGLGLPGLKPGYADKMQMAKAVAESMHAAADEDETELQQVLKASQLENDDALQRAIKDSQLSAEHMSSHNALSLSDMDATYFELEQTALERSLQSYSQKEEGKKQSASTTTSRPTTGDTSKRKTMRGDHKAPAVAAPAVSSATACLPCPSQESIPLAAAAASSSVASAASRGGGSESSSATPLERLLPVEEYPSAVQELVMNGFPLSNVVKAFDLVGNNFDNMLSLCLANANRAP